jgi:hypothetical protein
MHRYLLGVLGMSAVLLAACGGGGSNVFIASPTPPPTAAPVGNVSFLFIVPSASSTTARRRNITLPSSAQSAKITLDSVNGTAQSGTPVVANLSSSTAGCQQTAAQLSCAVNVSAPVGTLVFTLQIYGAPSAGGSVIAEGNVSLSTTAGQTTTAPATLGGTISKIVLAVSDVAEVGNPSSVPVTIMAEDSNGNTILGAYNAAVTLTDTDASAQTSLSVTNIPDSTTAAGVTLNYLGGAMSTGAVLSASATGVAAGNVTNATFSPDATNPQVAGNTVTFAYSDAYAEAENTVPPTTTTSYTGSNTESYSTGTYAGISNVIIMDGDYYAWTQQGSSLTLDFLGEPSDSYTCASPYYQEFVIPLPSSWNVQQGAGACTYSYNYFDSSTDFENENDTYNSDGSYSGNYSYNYTYCCSLDAETEAYSDDSAGNANASVSYEGASGSNPSYTLNIPAPTGGATQTVTYNVFPAGTIPPSGTPAPTTTTAPNIWTAIGVTALAGKPPSPLVSDVYTPKGPVASLPAACTVSSTILGTNPTLTEIDEAYSSSDPLDYNEDLYYTEANKYYYLSGVGEVCELETYTSYEFDDDALNYYTATNPDQNWDGCIGTDATYLTATTLTASNRTRTTASSAPPIAAVLAAAIQSHRLQVRQQHIKRVFSRRRTQMPRGKLPLPPAR